MATKETEDTANVEKLNANLARIEELSQRLVTAMSSKTPKHPGLEGPGEDLYLKAAAAFMTETMEHPSKLIFAIVVVVGNLIGASAYGLSRTALMDMNVALQWWPG